MTENPDEGEQLKREVGRLKREIEELKKKLEKEQEEKEAIKKEFEEYKVRHPENVGVKNGKLYVIVPKNISPERKKPGAKPGHKPFWRKMPVSVDKKVSIPVMKCPHCGNESLSEEPQIRKRTVEDIPVCKPIVTRYLLHRRFCSICNRYVEVPFTYALPKARLGIRLMLMVTWFKIGLRMTEEAIPKVLKTCYGIAISEGEVTQILDQVAREFGPFYNQLIESIRDAKARHMDETSWRIFGENAWLWAFITKGEALYVIARSRGHEVPLEVLGTHPKGVDIHDRYSAYKTLARKTGNRPQQDCWAHFLDDAEELAQNYCEEGQLILRVLKKTYDDAMKVQHTGSIEDVERLYHYMKGNLDRQYTSGNCRKFVKNLLDDKDNLFIFVTNPDVDATNNAAERALRHTVIARKISGGSKSIKGTKTYQTLVSVVKTLEKRGQDMLKDGSTILFASHG